jgi:hypothetical protein
MRPTRRTLLGVLVAVLGIGSAAAITWGTSQLVRQRIGLASEPLTAGRRLLPSVTATAPRAVPPASLKRDEGATARERSGGAAGDGGDTSTRGDD